MSDIGNSPRRNSSRLFLAVLIGLALLFCPACTEEAPPVKVDLSKRVPTEALKPPSAEGEFRFGIGAMITPKDGYNYYKQIIDYLAEKMEQPIQTIDRGTYDEFNTLLENRQIDAAFVCGGPYVEGKKRFDLQLLALPEGNNGPVYFSYLIVPSNSPARSLEDLRGKKFAFTDPKSNSGMVVPSFWLAKMSETPESFFAKHIFTYAHDASIKAVMDNLVDGAAVDSLIWDYMNSQNPEVGVKTRIIKRSEAFGIPPVVVRPGLSQDKRKQLQKILLNMHNDPDGKKILHGMNIKRFVLGQDSDYDTIRKMQDYIRKQDGAS